MIKPQKVNGTLIIDQVTFSRILEREVIKNNDTSGKVIMPKVLIGKKVRVVWDD